MPNDQLLDPITPNSETAILNVAFYSPASLLAIFNSLINLKEEKKIIQVRGVFKKTAVTTYGGMFYNKLRDESSDYTMTVITPALIHNQLVDNKTVEFYGFITRKTDRQGRIELYINMTELTAQKINKYSEEEVKKIELINKKVVSGFIDLDAYIKDAVFHNKRLAIKIIMGRSGIIDSDINRAMEEAVALYDIEYYRVSLSSPTEIIAKLQSLDNEKSDVICVARGGGENLEIFENLDICGAILECKTIVASAIGHADNVSLFEKLSDKKFITPTQFGSYLREIYNRTIEEYQNSKAKIIQDTKAELTTLYSKQLENLTAQLKSTKELNEKTLEDTKKNYTAQMETLSGKLKSFEELVKQTTEEKTKLYQTETEILKKQFVDITKIHQDQLNQINSLQEEQKKSLMEQIASLNNQQTQKEKLLNQTNSLADDYKRQLKEAQGKSKLNVFAIIIAVIAGLILGAILFSRS